MIRRALTVCALALAIAAPLHAQHSLVLSGGGARGLAHAGAIVALEELGYRPSLVVGTSMGAIIGALYAAGYSAQEIRDIVARQNWLEEMSADPIVFGPYRKSHRPLLGFGISRGRFYGGFLSAPGIDQQLIDLLFDAGVRARNDFDRLPLRYRAVGADLATGEEVVLGAGDLPRAVRASMAVPGAFSPVQWGERVLIDGGVANNLPVSVARDLSAAPIIAIDVLRPRLPVEERSALDLALRSIRLLIENARPEAEPDILVLPRVAPGYAETSFPADASDVLRRGYEAAREQVPPITPAPESRRTPGPAPARIHELRVEGADAAAERLIRRIMRGNVREYDAPRIVEGTSSLYRTGLFQSVWPRVEFTDDDRAVLVVDVTPVASTSVSGGAHWDNDLGGAAWASLRQSLSLNTPVELRLSGVVDQLGQSGSFASSFFSALVPGLVWNGGAHAFDRRYRILGGDSIAAHARVQRAGGWGSAELRGPIPNWLFSSGVRAEHMRVMGENIGWSIGPFVRIARSPAPDRTVAVDPLIEGEVRGGDLEYQRARIRVGHARTLGNRLRAGVLLDVTGVSRETPPDAFPVVDTDMAPWLPSGAVPYRTLGVIGADLALPIVLNGHARLRLRALTAMDDVSFPGSGNDWEPGAELGAIWPTVLGPIAIGAAVGRHSHWRLNLSVGSVFRAGY